MSEIPAFPIRLFSVSLGTTRVGTKLRVIIYSGITRTGGSCCRSFSFPRLKSFNPRQLSKLFKFIRGLRKLIHCVRLSIAVRGTLFVLDVITAVAVAVDKFRRTVRIRDNAFPAFVLALASCHEMGRCWILLW